MPQKIHLLNTKNRPAVGRISILAELGLRPIQAEPVHIRITGTQWIQDPENRFDTVEIRDSLFSAIRRTEAAILDDLPKAFSLPEGTLERKEIPQLPAMVIREAVVNAVMHRNYRTHSPIQIIRYSNRLEIRNPGHSLKPEERLGEPGSKPRNPAIAAVLHETHLAETKGSGIKVMRDLMDRANLEPPTFKSSRAADEFVAIFLFYHFLTEENLRWLNGFAEHALAQEDQKALIYVRETDFIDNASYRDINQVDTLTASSHLRHLRDLGLLEMAGKGAKTYYRLSPSLLKPDKLSAKPDNLQPKPDNLSGEPADLLAVPEILSQMPKKLRDTVLAVGKKAPKETLRYAILALCHWRELTANQLAGILRRNRTFLVGEHLKPMVDAGDLRLKYPQENHPQQAYSSKLDSNQNR
jgi:ATP-dependent DNA helicase RecG